MTVPATPRVRLDALDAFRGLAAFWVVLYHVLLRYPHFMAGRDTPAEPLLPGFAAADVGVVPVLWFFLISGFVITWTVDRCRTPADFVVSRVSRIYPAYWASLLLTVALLALWPLPGAAPSLRDVLVNATMLQAYLLVPNVAGVYWSLAVELAFYAYALALFATGLWRHVHRAALAWACVCLAAAVVEQTGTAVPWRVNQLLLLQHAPFLVAGMMLYQLWRGHRRFWSVATAGVCVVTMFILYPAGPALTCLLAMGLIAAASHGRLRWLAVPPLVWLGSISYSLYLVHEYPAYMVLRVAGLAGWPHWLAAAAAVAVALMLATAVTYGVERPALQAIRYAWRERTTSRGQPAAPIQLSGASKNGKPT
jgi:peptidoglycan/LPS O-acetylase OafA/YrhL